VTKRIVARFAARAAPGTLARRSGAARRDPVPIGLCITRLSRRHPDPIISHSNTRRVDLTIREMSDATWQRE